MRVYFAEGIFGGGDLCSPHAKKQLGHFFLLLLNIMLNFLAAFLCEGTKLKFDGFLCPRMKQGSKDSQIRRNIAVGGLQFSNGSWPCYCSSNRTWPYLYIDDWNVFGI